MRVVANIAALAVTLAGCGTLLSVDDEAREVATADGGATAGDGGTATPIVGSGSSDPDASRDADAACTPDKEAACAGKECGPVSTPCGEVECGSCGTGFRCDANACVCTKPTLSCGCEPRELTELCGARKCGRVMNCGVPESCGTCVAPNDTCDGNGQCVCVARDASEFCGTKKCGTAKNNCGATVSCGTCTAPNDTCDANGQCVCVGRDASEFCGTKKCGTATNNCGDTISCGTCPGANDTCSPTGQCVCTPTVLLPCAGRCQVTVSDGCGPVTCGGIGTCLCRCGGVCSPEGFCECEDPPNGGPCN